MLRSVLSCLAAVAVGACANSQASSRSDATLILEGQALSIHNAWEMTFEEVPFEKGAMSVIAEERGKLRTFRLVPCHNGIVCAGSERGRHGALEITDSFYIVRGLYGRTFWLSAGGDGAMERHGQVVPLAWDSVVVDYGPE